MTRSALYRGSLVHTRRDHLHRTFRYPAFMAALDLAETRQLDRALRLFSLDRPNLFSLYTRDYATSLDPRVHTSLDLRVDTSLDPRVDTSLDPRVHTSLDPRDTSLDPRVHTSLDPRDTSLDPRVHTSLDPRIDAALSFSRGHTREARPLARDVTSTTLVTNLRFAGYAFNPVSFFLRYAGDDLVSVIAEVNNTYGGRHCYTLDASNRIASVNGDGPLFRRVGFRTTREFFVSPFLHGPRVYEWWFPARRDPAGLAITMHVDTPDGARVFTATFAGERRALSDRALLGAALRYPVNTAQVIGLIHLEAMKLRFLHREPYRRPGPDHRPLDV